MRKIKICFISHFGYPLYNQNCKEPFGGGAGVQLFLISKELMRNENISCSVLTGNYSNNKQKIELFKNRIKIFKVLPIKRKLINYIKGSIIFFLTLRKIKPDIIIQRSASVLTGFSAIYCKLFKKIFIYSISSDSNVTGKDEKGYIGKIFKYGLDNANYVIAQKNEQINKLKSYKKRELSNVLIIKNSLEIKHSLKEKRSFILWVGRAAKVKRPELFLKLAKRFPDEKFIMICYKERNDNYWKNIVRISAKMLNLEFLEFIPFKTINNYFKEAKIFINTSRYEGFPNTFLQAFNNRTPVISLNVDPDHIFTNYKIGFFCNNNLSRMEYYLKLLIENNDLYESISDRAYKYVKKNNNIKKIIKKWNRLIENLFLKKLFK